MRNDDALIAAIEQLAAQKIGLSIPPDARERFATLVRGHATRYASLSDYRDFLQGMQADAEWASLARSTVSGETYFFRDHGQFDLLRLRLLPELIALHRHDRTLRLWSAGCASGEEAYSLAMLLDMLLPEQDGWHILILATDLDATAIALAKQGVYGQWSFRMVPDEIKNRYFTQKSTVGKGHTFILDERIRNRVTFSVANLLSEPEAQWHDMDLILCRNVFIYFEAAAVFRVANKLTSALRQGGYLMTAHTELIGHAVPELVSRLLAEGVVYQRKRASPPDVQMTIQPTAKIQNKAAQTQTQTQTGCTLLEQAKMLADKGAFGQAEILCNQVLSADTLATPAYFLLAQLLQIRGDFNEAMKMLNKALYLDHHFVAAYLELAALYERENDLARTHALRRAALGIVRRLPPDARIMQYETTAGELAKWLAQWE